ncbi:MAG: serine/threonine-protein kinase [Candidatus Magasanikbacteria bacterium]|nr:serine/threonine-protein kinase [Candidatus Magasanikbacteria bacterium]
MKTIVGNYEVIKELGEGGFATTYLVKHLILGVDACLKQNLEISPEDESLLIKEARLLWNIHHHSLPTLRDFLRCEDGSYALIMSFVKGKDLFKFNGEEKPRQMNLEDVCWITQRLLNAIHYLNYQGIVHGDIKPHNIMLTADEEGNSDHNAVLVDYGLSTFKPGRKSRCLGCSPAFAAPEQLEGKAPLPETDIYGLGISMLYALGGDIGAKTIPESVPKKMRVFFQKMIVRDIDMRPKSAGDLIRPLSDLREELFGRRSSGRKLKIF